MRNRHSIHTMDARAVFRIGLSGEPCVHCHVGDR